MRPPTPRTALAAALATLCAAGAWANAVDDETKLSEQQIAEFNRQTIEATSALVLAQSQVQLRDHLAHVDAERRAAASRSRETLAGISMISALACAPPDHAAAVGGASTCSLADPDADSFIGRAAGLAYALWGALSILALTFAGFRIALGRARPVEALWQAASPILIAGLLLVFWHRPFAGLNLELPTSLIRTWSPSSALPPPPTTTTLPATVPVMLQAIPLIASSATELGWGDAINAWGSAATFAEFAGRRIGESLYASRTAADRASESWLRRVRAFATEAGARAMGWLLEAVLGFVVALPIAIVVLGILFLTMSQYIAAELMVAMTATLGILTVPFYVLPATRFLWTGWLKSFIGLNLYAMLTKLLGGVGISMISWHLRNSADVMVATAGAGAWETGSDLFMSLFWLMMLCLTAWKLISFAGPLSTALASGAAAAPPGGPGPLTTAAAGTVAAVKMIAAPAIAGAAAGARAAAGGLGSGRPGGGGAPRLP